LDLWKTLLTSAQLGTEHRAPQIPADAIDLFGTLLVDSPEAALLNAIAVASVYRRAGVVPETQLNAQVDIAPPEILPVASPQALLHLRNMLRTPSFTGMLLQEWLDIISAKGKRVAAAYLPQLFDQAINQRDNQHLVAAVKNCMGERGHWLAAQNTKWKFLLDESDFDQSSLAKHAAQNEAAALKALQSEVPINDASVIQTLDACQHPWSEQLTAAFIEKFKGARKDKTANVFLGRYMNSLIPYMHFSMLGLLRALWVGNENGRSLGTNLIPSLIDSRQRMLQDLTHE
jgi:hypothetical protein